MWCCDRCDTSTATVSSEWFWCGIAACRSVRCCCSSLQLLVLCGVEQLRAASRRWCTGAEMSSIVGLCPGRPSGVSGRVQSVSMRSSSTLLRSASVLQEKSTCDSTTGARAVRLLAKMDCQTIRKQLYLAALATHLDLAFGALHNSSSTILCGVRVTRACTGRSSQKHRTRNCRTVVL